MDLFEFSTNMMDLSLYYCLRSPDFGMPNCSRYLATVRREMGKPFSFITIVSASSAKGWRLSSAAMASRSAALAWRDESSSPSPEVN